MNLEQATQPTFAAHQTFHPRFGWIKKGFDAAKRDENTFTRDDAPVALGVGKNMVEAIRFWSLATRVIRRDPNPDRPRMSVYTPTNFGHALLDSKSGLDPFIEDPTTLWMLHWQACRPTSLLPVWWLTFNEFTAMEFDEDELLRYVNAEIDSTTWPTPVPASVRKDVDCLLRTYSKRRLQGRQTLDDLLDSPFRDLGLIATAPTQSNRFRFVVGDKPGLSAAAITYAALDFMRRTDPDSSTVSLTRLTSDPGSPGRIMKLSERTILAALERSVASVSGLAIANPAGATQLAVDKDPADLALVVVYAHHRRRRPDIEFPNTAIAGPLAAEAAAVASSRRRNATPQTHRKAAS